MSTVVKDLGAVSAYAYAVEKGYTGTEAEFAELMADYAEVGQRAEDAADSALESKTAAQTAATTATNKASEATTAATTATTKAGEASTSASTAVSAKDTAVSASQTATTKATEATSAAATAVSAKDDAVSANTAAQSAKTAAQTAQTGAETAAASVSASAAQIATNAEDISQLKSDLTTKADATDMLKAFPTDTASGAIASFSDGANVPVKSLVVNIDPAQSGSGDPSPDNVRPISGWSEVNVGKCGKNLADAKFGTQVPSVTNGQLVNANGWATDFIGIDTTKAYTFSLSGNVTAYMFFYDSNYAFLGFQQTSTGIHAYRLDTISYFANAAFVKLRNDSVNANDPQMQLEVGATATHYEPYSGTSLTISLGQTVYGGKLDVTKGELVIDYAKITIDGSSTIGQTGSAVSSPVLIQVIPPAQDIAFIDEKTIPRCLCGSYLPPTTAYGIYRSADLGIAINQAESRISRRIWMRLPEVTTEAQAKTYLTDNPIDVVYPIYNPLTIQLTPHEVTALLGSNNVWADTGDSTVEYRADPTLYIQRLTEPDADMIADANITSGSYFMVGNTLYKATANIASGASIVPNVNCTRKSLSEALNELNV